MRIGIYDPYLDTMSGGEKYMLSIARCLAKKHDVTIFWDPSKKAEITNKAKNRFDFDLSSFMFTPSIFSHKVSFIDRFITSKKFDRIIILSDGSIPFLACKTILHFQSPIEWVTLNIKTKLKLARIKNVVCNSIFTKSHIDQKFGITSTVIYPPIILGKVEDISKTNTILNVGRFGINHAGSSYKKQEVLLETFKKMVDQGLNDWELVLLMSIKDEDTHIETLQRDANGYRVRFVINPENSVLWEEYAKAKVYWHASGFGEDLSKHPDRAEHFGMSTVEAMGMGAVPIVINAGGQKEIFTHEISGFLWNTQEELIAYTNKIIHSKELYEIISVQAREVATKFSEEIFCKQFFDLV